MKNQYFGDNRDLFKYDLVWNIASAGLARRFTFLPMLTPDDHRTDGDKDDRRQARAGTKNQDLAAFLDLCRREGRRDIGEITGFLQRKRIAVHICFDLFSRETRGRYFRQVDDDLLQDALILVDPDIGLEVNRPTEQHLLFSEASNLYDRMGEKSILMLYQHFPREPHLDYLNKRSGQLHDLTGDEPICIDDDEIIFFFLTKDRRLEASLSDLIRGYAESYSA